VPGPVPAPDHSLRQAIAPIEQATHALLDEISPALLDALWQVEGSLRTNPFIARIRASAKATAGAR
jgi:hypothetical protein